MPSFKKLILILGIVAVASFAAGNLSVGEARTDRAETLRNLERFSRVYQKIVSSYVSEQDSDELVDAAIDAMIEQLDPFSVYMDEDMLEDLMVKTRGEFGGLGIVISVRGEYPTVISPILDTPASRLGIHGGDKIVEIEGESTKGWNVQDAVDKLRGPQGSPVTIGIERFGVDEIVPYTIVRDIIPVTSVPYSFVLGEDVGYVRVTNFAEKTVDELKDAIDDLEAQGIRGLILDLRNNPGGLLNSAREVSDLFLNSGKIIVSTRGRDGRRLQEIYAAQDISYAKDYPLVVMINEGSASASEIVAGAVQDWDRGLVVGRNSFGKGSVQSIFNVTDREAIKLTTARYYTPSGRCIHKEENDERHDAEEFDGEFAILDDEPADEQDPPELEITTTPELPIAETDSLPIFETLNLGRPVRGGGGIMPDIVLAGIEISDTALDLERRSAFFNFATELTADMEIDLDFTVTDDLVARFAAWLAGKEIEIEPEALSENDDYVRMAIRRSAFQQELGSPEAYRSTLHMDRELQETLKLLKERGDLEGLFVASEDAIGNSEEENH
ncbi:MAG: S41 family peptidase [bacterium]|nr:S41 family peptidase [bacterium]